MKYNCLFCIIISVFFLFSCRKTAQNEKINESTAYLSYILKETIRFSGTKLDDWNLIHSNDTLQLSQLVKNGNTLIVYVSQFGCNKCNMQLYNKIMKLQKTILRKDILILGDNVGQREGKLLYGNDLYTLYGRRNYIEQKVSMALFILDPSLKASCFFIPDNKHLELLDIYLDIIKERIETPASADLQSVQ